MRYNSFRFQELERYDPCTDSEKVCFMAVTDIGTFHSEVTCGQGRERREFRKQFRDHALVLMDEGSIPCEIDLT